MFAEAHMSCGDSDSGLVVIDEAIDMALRVDERFFLADYQRLKAELLLSAAKSATEAEACLAESLRIAREQNAKSFELRSATAQARLWSEAGKREAAIELLAPVRNWFTEGFDTPDLKKSKTLLDELEA